MSENVLSARQRKALAALLGGATVAGAAEAAGVNARTVTRWRESAAFRAALAEGQGELLSSTVRALATVARAAVGVLGRTLLDDTARPADRLRAAAIVLDRLLPMAEMVDLAARVAALEEVQDAKQSE